MISLKFKIMETPQIILTVLAAIIVAGSFIMSLVALIKSRTHAEVEKRFDDVDDYEASLSGLSVEEIREQNKNIKRGVKK